jgi:hypothetical protein
VATNSPSWRRAFAIRREMWAHMDAARAAANKGRTGTAEGQLDHAIRQSQAITRALVAIRDVCSELGAR